MSDAASDNVGLAELKSQLPQGSGRVQEASTITHMDGDERMLSQIP